MIPAPPSIDLLELEYNDEWKRGSIEESHINGWFLDLWCI